MSFFQSIIPSSRPEIAILIGLIIICLVLLSLRHRIRYILIIPLVAGAIFVLGMLIFPLYEQGPNIQNRVTKTVLYIIPGNAPTTSNSIHIKEENSNEKILPTQQKTQQILREDVAQQISFVSTQTGDETQCLIQFPNGSLLEIFPQSAVFLQANHTQIEIRVVQGRATYLASGSTILTKFQGVEQMTKTISQSTMKLLNDYQQKGVKSILQQAGGNLTNNTTTKNISKFLLNILSKIFPDRYKKNLENFYAFQQYTKISTGNIIEDISDKKIQEDIISQTNKGLKETKIYQWIQQIFK